MHGEIRLQSERLHDMEIKYERNPQDAAQGAAPIVSFSRDIQETAKLFVYANVKK